MLGMFDFGSRDRKMGNSSPVGSLMCQSNIGKPVKDAIDGDTINTGMLVVTQQLLDIAMAERLLNRLEQTENPDAGSRYAPSC